MSQTTTRAPSSAKRTAASRPIPIPAPVMSATLPFSLVPIRCVLILAPPHSLSPRLAARGERLSSNSGPLPLRGRGIQKGSLSPLGSGQQLSWVSSVLSTNGGPATVMFEHGVEYGEQLTHARGESELGSFAGR